jgi:hypothetical protein
MPATSLLISHREMQAAQEHGKVRPLCQAIPEFCKWYGTWWLLSADGWLRITDAHLAGRLDRIQMRLDIAEEEQTCRQVQCPITYPY